MSITKSRTNQSDRGRRQPFLVPGADSMPWPISEHAERKTSTSSQPDEVRRAFQSLANHWQEQTFGNSCIDELIEHPAYQAIIGLGVDVLPFLLQDLGDHPGRWLYALQQITREDPSSGAEEVDTIAAAWKQWGTERGYL